jgi:hypothetical protein
MEFRDPFAAYNAANNVEAHLVRNLLENSGVPAFVVEDVSQVGVWVGGFISELHKPQVWIERADAGRAKPVLDAYESKTAGRPAAADGGPVEVTCEKCGKRSEFPAAQKGSVQNCPHCYAYVDVGDEVPFDDWSAAPDEDEPGRE